MTARDLAPIAPPPLSGLPALAPGPAPELRWIPTAALRVDAAYQRRITERAAGKLIDQIAAGFAWARFGALTVAHAGDGAFAVIDGQHRAAAAVARGIESVPCVVVDAEGVPAEAGAFVGLNRDRRNVTALHIFWAQLAEGDKTADAVAQGVERAGGRILRAPRVAADCKPGETMATSALRKVAERKGVAGVQRVMGIAVRAGLAPVQSVQIKTIAALLWEPEFAGQQDARLSEVIGSQWEQAHDAADVARLDTGQSLTRCLALEIARRARGARAA